jgi:hypothetical protein
MWYKIINYIAIHNSQFIRSISCISSNMFRLIYRAILKLVFGVVWFLCKILVLSAETCSYKYS